MGVSCFHKNEVTALLTRVIGKEALLPLEMKLNL